MTLNVPGLAKNWYFEIRPGTVAKFMIKSSLFILLPGL
jgi:hypothetical protein